MNTGEKAVAEALVELGSGVTRKDEEDDVGVVGGDEERECGVGDGVCPSFQNLVRQFTNHVFTCCGVRAVSFASIRFS